MISEKEFLTAEQSMNDLLTNEEIKQIVELRGLYDMYYKVSVSLVEYRMANSMSQKDLAGILNVSQAMISKLESGDYNYTIEQLWKVSRKLDFKFDIVFEPAVAAPLNASQPFVTTSLQDTHPPVCQGEVPYTIDEMGFAA